MSDAELKPPDVEMSEAMDAGRGEGSAVVAANGIGKSMLAEEPAKLSAYALGTDVVEPWQQSK